MLSLSQKLPARNDKKIMIMTRPAIEKKQKNHVLLVFLETFIQHIKMVKY